jgi:soluble lytic murein transglycosylase-like protein
MARIPQYNQSVGLGAPATPSPNLSSAVGQELEGFGGALQTVAATIQEKQQQRENFAAENSYRKFKLDLQSELETRAAAIEPGGAGFHDGYMTEVFKPKRDAFLATVPERLKPQFEAMLDDNEGAETTQWSISAAATERDEMYRWQKDEIASAQDELANAISMQPEAYDSFLDEGNALIETSSLPTSEKERLKNEWSQIAQIAHLNQMLANDPEGVLRELGADARNLSPTTQFSILSRAVQWQESRDNPNAVSGKGAVGLMQVMPATAAEIATELGDAKFPHGAPEGAIRSYLSNPSVNKTYGEHYLKKQLRAFASTRNPIETALVAYNAGPSVAERWVESGYDDKVLSKETRDYKKTIMASLTSPAAKGSAKDVKFTGTPVGETNPDLVSRTADAFATLGLTNVKINSAGRDAEHNAAVGGASGSQHLENNALDIDVKGMSIPQRIELIKSLSAAGITGLGIYPNAIHVDLAGRRAWGPSHGFDTVPKWASNVIGEHLKGTTPPPRAIGSRYASLPYDKVQAFTTKADQTISQQQAALAKSSATDKVEIKRQMDNELALIRTTGSGSGAFDETNVSTILGEDAYMTFAYKKDVAQRTFTAKDGIAQMSPEEMEQRFSEYAPLPGASDFAAQQEIQTAVQREIDRVSNLRSNQPDQAALEYPPVKEAYDALQQSMTQGDPPANEVQSFVRLMLETQADFNIAPEAMAPVPRDWAMRIGRLLTAVPENTGKQLDAQRAAVIETYGYLQTFFGDYTDEVLTYALSEYKGLSKPMAEVLTSYVTQLRMGVGIFRPKAVDNIADQEQVDSFGYDFQQEPLVRGIKRVFGVDPGPLPGQENEGLSPEEQLRLKQTEEQ